MRLGLELSNFTWPGREGHVGGTFTQLAQGAERAGFFSLWVMDRFCQLQQIGPVESDMLEGWADLAYAAGRTNRIRLGTLVTGVPYRHPGILVKTATTLDVLSHGRAYFGIGASWHEQEHRRLGIRFPSTPQRYECLERPRHV